MASQKLLPQSRSYTTQLVAEDIKQYAKSKEVDEEDRSTEALALRQKIEEPEEGRKDSLGRLEVPPD